MYVSFIFNKYAFMFNYYFIPNALRYKNLLREAYDEF